MNILVLNAGSATVKFQVVVTDADRIAGDQDVKLLRGQIERIGGEAVITIRNHRRQHPKDHRRRCETCARRWIGWWAT
ncbi:hypothetical protein [Gemmatimonas sp.]|uniref:hypothetical protein n=1 Tax=Gemmatimonas sp. TaxID=1962908 RepID=UPI003DA63A72